MKTTSKIAAGILLLFLIYSLNRYAIEQYHLQNGFVWLVALVFIGIVLKKILKLVITIAGVALGLFFIGLYYMQSRGYIQKPGVDWNKVGNYIANTTQQWAGNVQNLTFTHNVVHQLGIPVTNISPNYLPCMKGSSRVYL